MSTASDTFITPLKLNIVQASMIYRALSNTNWVGANDSAHLNGIRKQIEKSTIKKMGWSMHERLLEQGEISSNYSKPDVRTKKEKLEDLIKRMEEEEE